MSLPPMIMRMRFRGRRGGSFRLWIPLFLFWPLLLLLLLPALAVGLVVSLVVPRWNLGPLLAGVWRVLCECRGLHVDVDGRRGSTVFIAFQ